MRICPRCGVCPVGKTKSGKPLDYCAVCQRHRTIEKQQAFKIACIEYTGNVCAFCAGQIECPASLCYRDPIGSPATRRVSSMTGAVPLRDEVLKVLDTKVVCCSNCERLNYRASSGSPPKGKAQIVSRLGGCCAQCGETRPVCLDVHHRAGRGDSSKNFSVGDRVTRGWSAIAEELDKCVLLCANCHSAHHFAEAEAKRQKEWEEIMKKKLDFASAKDYTDVSNDGRGVTKASAELEAKLEEEGLGEDKPLEDILDE